MELSTQRQKHSLYTVAGLDEFVITPAPNSYIVALRLSTDHAAAVGHDRIAIFIDVLNDGHSIGLRSVRTVLDDNSAGVEIEPECHENGCYSDILTAVLSSQEIGEHSAELVCQFLEDVGGFEVINGSGYYNQTSEVSVEGRIHDMLAKIFGE